MAANAAKLGIDVLDRHLRACCRQRADLLLAALLVDPADVDGRERWVGLAGLAAGVGEIVGDGTGAGPTGSRCRSDPRVREFGVLGVLDVPEFPLPQPAAMSAATATAAIPTSLLRACLPTTSSSAGTPMLRIAKTCTKLLVNNLGATMFAYFC
jgi:hypothetical protein